MDVTAVGLFDRPENAHSAVQDLRSAGISDERISVLAAHREGETDDANDDTMPDGTTVGQNVAGGAIAGGVGGLALGLAALVVPGLGPLLAAGPIAATLAGAGVGALGGGVIGALKAAGIDEEDATLYGESLHRGGTLVIVHCDEDEAEQVGLLLDQNGAADVDERRAREFGERMAADPRYQGRPYQEVEADLRADYHRANPDSMWDDVKGAVKEGWSVVLRRQ